MTGVTTGVLSLVGVGPGDPELLTLKAVRVIGAADVVAFPETVSGGALAREIAAGVIAERSRLLPIRIPMAVERAPAQEAYDEGAAAIARALGEGANVAFLCEGDPLFYGSAMYLLSRLADRVRVEIVPGVTSLTAAAAATGRPLAARNEVLKVLPAPLADEELRRELLEAPAVAIIKVGRHFDRVRALLEASGHAEAALVVEHATTVAQKITPLRAYPAGERPYFSTILAYRGAEAWGQGTR